MKAGEYFDRKASVYAGERGGTGFIGKLVKKEQEIALELLAVKANESVLDVGCGSGHYGALIREAHGVPFGIDIAPKMVLETRKLGIAAEVCNIELERPKGVFDKALCAGALEFMRHPEQGAQNIYESLKRGGVFVCIYPRTSPAGFLYKAFHLSHGVRIRLFSRNGLHRLLAHAGFRIYEDRKADPITNVVRAEKG
ncbi:class I SAM-dependent methyltransferase [Candidatus Woesearchaeota archaeon]|nr:class I SAM-dependent methyltransferase [Candidatus Woesearchaeota archaeon]